MSKSNDEFSQSAPRHTAHGDDSDSSDPDTGRPKKPARPTPKKAGAQTPIHPFIRQIENQRRHDLTNHRDIATLSTSEQLHHYAVHLAKYAARMHRYHETVNTPILHGSLRAEAKTDFQKTLVDTALISLSIMRLLGHDQPMLQNRALSLTRRSVETRGLNTDLHDTLEHLAKLIDDSDHKRARYTHKGAKASLRNSKEVVWCTHFNEMAQLNQPFGRHFAEQLAVLYASLEDVYVSQTGRSLDYALRAKRIDLKKKAAATGPIYYGMRRR